MEQKTTIGKSEYGGYMADTLFIEGENAIEVTTMKRFSKKVTSTVRKVKISGVFIESVWDSVFMNFDHGLGRPTVNNIRKFHIEVVENVKQEIEGGKITI